jgi:UDP-N-acetylmuramate dehydrogenase
MLKHDVDLAPYTHIRIGGRAEALWAVTSRAELEQALRWRAAHGIEDHVVIGGGANLLINDERSYPLVIAVERDFVGAIRAEPDRVIAEAGVRLSRLVRAGVEAGWDGFELLAGIPGTVGGAVVMNAGIPTFETFDLVREVRGLDLAGDEVRLTTEELSPGYRHGNLPPGLVVTEVAFEKRPGDPHAMASTARRLKEERRAKQPLQYPSFGSTFMNPGPALNGGKPSGASARASSARPSSGWGSSAAGALIERAGLKGARLGDAQLSEMHANFVVNLGRARARDVLALMVLARRAVGERFGVWLVPEVRLVGFAPGDLVPLLEEPAT